MTNAELAVLGLVAEHPRYGYEIEQVIADRGMRDWTDLAFSSIYYLLKKMEQAGLVESDLAAGAGGPARKVYQVTGAGFAALQQGLLESLSVLKNRNSSILLGLAGFPALPPAEAAASLQKYLAGLEKRQADLCSKRERQRPIPYFVEAMFEYSLALLEAEEKWLRGFLNQIKEKGI